MVRKRHVTIIVLVIILSVIIFLSARKDSSPKSTMRFRIEHLWNSKPITNHQSIEITLSSTEKRDYLQIEIDAPVFNDPAPPSISAQPGPYPELWNYEVVELFFLASSTGHYLELEFSPHDHYLVLLLTARRKIFKQMLPLTTYKVEHPSADRWIGRALVPRSLFPAFIDRFNAYAIHGQGANRTYEALYPATVDSEQPDFHRLEFFQLFQIDSLLNTDENDGDYWKNN